MPLAVRSGGHGISGRSTNDGGIVIDVGAIDGVEVLDRRGGWCASAPGARWGDVAQALAPHGLAMSSGDYGDVGVGGLATAGGIGFLARKLRADPRPRTRPPRWSWPTAGSCAPTPTSIPDLFWALRGAGGNFGIVTAFELEADEVGDVVFASLRARRHRHRRVPGEVGTPGRGRARGS